MPYTPQEAAAKARFVQFAYSMFGDGSNLNPAPDPGLASLGYTVLANMTAQDLHTTKFYGYIAAAASTPGDLVIAIRGTQTPAEWLLDFSALPLPFMDLGLVAAGFRSIAQSILITVAPGSSMSLTDAIVNLNAQHAITSVTVLGHSLGGALATLVAAELASANPANVKSMLSVWTYASPRVGLPDFMSKFNSQIPTTYRIWNVLDIVPEVPTFPYVHVGGNGEKLTQSEQQLQELVTIPSCEHHLTTYQWVLESSLFKLDCDCDHECEVPAPAAGAMALDHADARAKARRAQARRVSAAERARGAHALFVALQ